MVLVLVEILCVIEHHERQDHLRDWNLVQGNAARSEVSRRIDVGAVLSDNREEVRAKPVLLDSIGLVGLGIGGRGNDA